MPEQYVQVDWDLLHSQPVREYAVTVEGRMAQGRGLIIIGPVGVGKSSAASLVMREAAKVQVPVNRRIRTPDGVTETREPRLRWSYVPDLLDLLRSSPSARIEECKKQEAADLLVWDDFLVRDLADWEVGFLDQVVESRYRNRRPMVVTTNVAREVMAKDQRLGRMIDRWRQTCMGVTIDEASRRKPL